MKFLYEKINNLKMTRTEKKIADFFLEFGEDIFFMNSKEIGNVLNTSDTSIIRFVKRIGFNNFKDFKDFIKSNLQVKMSSVPQFMENIEELKHNTVEKLLLNQTNKNISFLLEKNSLKQAENIANLIYTSKDKYIVGLKSTMGLAHFMGIRLSFMLNGVYTFFTADTNLFNNVRNIKEKDILLIFDYPTYSSEAVLLCEIAKKKSATIILISDSNNSPCSIYADIHFSIKIKGISVFHSLIPSQFFIEYVLCLISKKMNQGQKKDFIHWKKFLAKRK